jgi:hypothetical protein
VLKQIDLFRIETLALPPESQIDISKLKLQLSEGIRSLWRSYEGAMNHSTEAEDAQSIGVLGEFNYEKRLTRLHTNLAPHMNTLYETLLQQVKQGSI